MRRTLFVVLSTILLLVAFAVPASAHTRHVHRNQHCADGSHYVHMHRGDSGGRPDYYAGCESGAAIDGSARPAARASRGSASGDALDRLAKCETGKPDPWNHASIHNPSGKYHGAFQFSLSTWQNLAGMSGDPHNYAYGTQKEAANRVGTKYGWQHWPHCSRVAGLR